MYKFLKEYHRIKYDIELTLEHKWIEIVEFCQCLKYWWNDRPRKIQCDYCGYKFWSVGEPDCPVYCNEHCAYYGGLLDEDDIPF